MIEISFLNDFLHFLIKMKQIKDRNVRAMIGIVRESRNVGY
jgi:hypothetical protein